VSNFIREAAGFSLKKKSNKANLSPIALLINSTIKHNARRRSTHP
jgi:hypothetical protein